MREINLNLNLKLLVNGDDIEILECTPELTRGEPMNERLEITRNLQKTEIRYGILMLGATSSIGKLLIPNADIIIAYEDKEFNGRIHSKIKGRIDRLTDMLDLFTVNDMVKMTYSPAENTIKMEKIID